MIPWILLDRVETPGGAVLTLHRRGEEFVIRVDGQDLMGSRQSGSERSLAELGCAGASTRRRARVLIGGLGMGFTLRAALDVLPADAQVEVAELVSAVVAWNRGPLAPLASSPLTDPRVLVHEGDVVARIAQSKERYDAILLDVDNGPEALTSAENSRLYSSVGLARSQAALRPGGVLAVWSAADDRHFTERLVRAGYRVAVERPLARHDARKRGGKRHVIWLATKPSR